MGRFKPWPSVSQATRNLMTLSSSRSTSHAHSSPSKMGPMGLAYGDLSKSGTGGGSGAGGCGGGGVIGPKPWGYRTVGVPGADDSTDPGILGRRLEVPE